MNALFLSLFPNLFQEFFTTSLIGKACEAGLAQCSTLQIRDFASPPHFKVDDTPYGGGPGMVMMASPLAAALIEAKQRYPKAKVILPSPSGSLFTQQKAQELSSANDLIFICGRYEGIDQRFVDLYVDEEFSIGDYVVMGGEIPSMVMFESILRLIPGVLGNEESPLTESFAGSAPRLEAPQYTKPRVFEGKEVPEPLLSGDHQRILQWREEAGLAKTRSKRPDLLAKKEQDEA